MKQNIGNIDEKTRTIIENVLGGYDHIYGPADALNGKQLIKVLTHFSDKHAAMNEYTLLNDGILDKSMQFYRVEKPFATLAYKIGEDAFEFWTFGKN